MLVLFSTDFHSAASASSLPLATGAAGADGGALSGCILASGAAGAGMAAVGALSCSALATGSTGTGASTIGIVLFSSLLPVATTAMTTTTANAGIHHFFNPPGFLPCIASAEEVVLPPVVAVAGISASTGLCSTAACELAFSPSSN